MTTTRNGAGRPAKGGCGRRYLLRVDQDVPVVEDPS